MWRPFLDEDEKRRIARAISEVESRTSGSIRVEILGRSRDRDLLELARLHFRKHPTPNGQGILILVSHLDHRFAIWGEEGIHSKAGHPLWERAARLLTEHFARRRYAEGLESCVRELGRELETHYPKSNG